MAHIAGYFAWVRTNKEGKPTCEKYHIWKHERTPESKAYYESITIKAFPLSEIEFALCNLDELAKRYPCPEVKVQS